MDDELIGSAVWRERMAARLSAESLASMVGISADDLTEAELGRRHLTTSELQSTASALGVPVSTLLGARPKPVLTIIQGGKSD